MALLSCVVQAPHLHHQAEPSCPQQVDPLLLFGRISSKIHLRPFFVWQHLSCLVLASRGRGHLGHRRGWIGCWWHLPSQQLWAHCRIGSHQYPPYGHIGRIVGVFYGGAFCEPFLLSWLFGRNYLRSPCGRIHYSNLLAQALHWKVPHGRFQLLGDPLEHQQLLGHKQS